MSKNTRPNKMLPNNRFDFSKISGTLPLPYLVEIQTESYKWFLEEGVEEVLKDIFPISNYTGNLEINYVSYRFDQPKYTSLECKIRDLTFSAPLKVTLRLNFKTTGEIKESEVFMGDFPMMTDSGTFIVNGAERVIVSQLVRSPGAYMSKTMDKSGKWIFNADLIPTRGTWLEFESDAKEILSVRIDRQRKMYASILLKALGLRDNQELVDLLD
ncbi:MAG: DNA-directed RNA polymerase subunit beta, partial [Methanomicrobia archaeon]|nr:DNA-directed RNA polymerase subunit beta [Methanomicrobia archaeon]